MKCTARRYFGLVACRLETRFFKGNLVLEDGHWVQVNTFRCINGHETVTRHVHPNPPPHVRITTKPGDKPNG